jgi:hypothetical protein
VYYIFVEIDLLILVLYVDELFLIGENKIIVGYKAKMKVEFKKDIDMMHYFLGLDISKRQREIFFGQGKYAIDNLKRFWIEDCKPMTTPMIINMKKVTTSDLELVDPTLCRHLIVL